MKYSHTENITDLLNVYLRTEGLETPLNEYKLMAAWPKIVGERLNRYTTHLEIKNQKLFVQVKSPAARQELMMSRTTILEALNQQVGTRVITEIVIF